VRFFFQTSPSPFGFRICAPVVPHVSVGFCRYEKSYMHRDVVTHVAVSPADFFITGSADGNLSHTLVIWVSCLSSRLVMPFDTGWISFLPPMVLSNSSEWFVQVENYTMLWLLWIRN
jgi:hypothetical protein